MQPTPPEPTMGYSQLEESGPDRKLSCLERAQYAFDNMTGMQKSRKLILFIVFIAILLDSMLLTTVVPIIPDFLWRVKHRDFNYTAQCISLAKNETMAARYHHLLDNSSALNKTGSVGGGGGSIGSFFSRMPYLNAERFYPDHIHEVALNESEISDCFRGAVAWRHKELEDMNLYIGVMFASKPVIQLFANPFIGPLTNRIGYSIPMFSGFVILFASTITFAFGQSYGVLCVARAIQGIGSASSSVSGVGLVATIYPEEEERGQALGIILSAFAFGAIIGPPYGGVMYQFVSKEAVFLLLAGLALLDGLLQLLVLKPGVRPEAQKGAPLKDLLCDPYILLVAGGITFGNMGLAILEPSLPIWMKDTMHSQNWEQGIIFLPCFVSYLISTNLFASLAFRIGRWLSAGLGMVLMGGCLIAVPFVKSIVPLAVSSFGVGLALGMVDSSLMPLMGYLVDLRHVSVYGSVCAIADIAFCLSYAVGSVLSGGIVKLIGFRWMMWTIAIIILCFAPLQYFLRDPPARMEEKALLLGDQERMQYQTHSIDQVPPPPPPMPPLKGVDEAAANTPTAATPLPEQWIKCDPVPASGSTLYPQYK